MATARNALRPVWHRLRVPSTVPCLWHHNRSAIGIQKAPWRTPLPRSVTRGFARHYSTQQTPEPEEEPSIFNSWAFSAFLAGAGLLGFVLFSAYTRNPDTVEVLMEPGEQRVVLLTGPFKTITLGKWAAYFFDGAPTCDRSTGKLEHKAKTYQIMVPAPESAARGFDGRVSLRQYIPAGGEVTVSWQMDQPLARVQLGPQLAERQKEGVLQFQAKDSQVLFIEFQNDTKQALFGSWTLEVKSPPIAFENALCCVEAKPGVQSKIPLSGSDGTKSIVVVASPKSGTTMTLQPDHAPFASSLTNTTAKVTVCRGIH